MALNVLPKLKYIDSRKSKAYLCDVTIQACIKKPEIVTFLKYIYHVCKETVHYIIVHV